MGVPETLKRLVESADADVELGNGGGDVVGVASNPSSTTCLASTRSWLVSGGRRHWTGLSALRILFLVVLGVITLRAWQSDTLPSLRTTKVLPAAAAHQEVPESTTRPPRTPPHHRVETRPEYGLCEPRPPARTTHDSKGRPFTSPSPALPLSATLEDRLAVWRAAPLVSHESWTALNNQTCSSPTVVENINKLHFGVNVEKWRGMNESHVERARNELTSELEGRQKAGQLHFRYNGTRGRRGIVFTAGNADTFERVIVILRMVRSYGTTLPAEVFHFANEAPTSAQIFEYTKYDAVARVVDVGKDDKEGRTKAFHVKGAALILSEFEELLYLDSDSIPAKDPTSLFDSPGYKEYGAMFWPDYWKDSAENAIWSILGVQCRDEWTMEAGQMLINKAHHMDVLYLVHHMLDVPNYPFFFTLSDGDKDLFRYAFLALRKRWAVPGRHLDSASWTSLDFLTTQEYCGHTMLQYDSGGQPAFVHANLLKRIVAPLGRGSTWGKTQSLPLPPLDATFPLGADHLANPDSQGNGLVTTNLDSIRFRNLAEQGHRTDFHSGFRANNYVLCIGRSYNSTESLEVKAGCKPSEAQEQLAASGLELMETLWEDDEVLKGFEALFYDKLGKAGSSGF